MHDRSFYAALHCRTPRLYWTTVLAGLPVVLDDFVGLDGHVNQVQWRRAPSETVLISHGGVIITT